MATKETIWTADGVPNKTFATEAEAIHAERVNNITKRLVDDLDEFELVGNEAEDIAEWILTHFVPKSSAGPQAAYPPKAHGPEAPQPYAQGVPSTPTPQHQWPPTPIAQHDPSVNEAPSAVPPRAPGSDVPGPKRVDLDSSDPDGYRRW